MECKICEKEFPRWDSLKRHISTNHYPYLAYLAKHEGKSNFSKKHLRKMYVKDKKSTPMMSSAAMAPRSANSTSQRFSICALVALTKNRRLSF